MMDSAAALGLEITAKHNVLNKADTIYLQQGNRGHKGALRTNAEHEKPHRPTYLQLVAVATRKQKIPLCEFPTDYLHELGRGRD